VQPATRATQHWAILATVAGALVLVAVTGLSLGAVPPLPAEVTLGVSLPVFYGATLGAITPASRRGPVARRAGQRPDHGTPAIADGLRRPSEAQRVRAWRRASLAALGVPDDVALVLAEDPSFSVHELKRLLAAGCPLGTALRILWPT
jgi:hypothetical protein